MLALSFSTLATIIPFWENAASTPVTTNCELVITANLVALRNADLSLRTYLLDYARAPTSPPSDCARFVTTLVLTDPNPDPSLTPNRGPDCPHDSYRRTVRPGLSQPSASCRSTAVNCFLSRSTSRSSPTMRRHRSMEQSKVRRSISNAMRSFTVAPAPTVLSERSG